MSWHVYLFLVTEVFEECFKYVEALATGTACLAGDDNLPRTHDFTCSSSVYFVLFSFLFFLYCFAYGHKVNKVNILVLFVSFSQQYIFRHVDALILYRINKTCSSASTYMTANSSTPVNFVLFIVSHWKVGNLISCDSDFKSMR